MHRLIHCLHVPKHLLNWQMLLLHFVLSCLQLISLNKFDLLDQQPPSITAFSLLPLYILEIFFRYLKSVFVLNLAFLFEAPRLVSRLVSVIQSTKDFLRCKLSV